MNFSRNPAARLSSLRQMLARQKTWRLSFKRLSTNSAGWTCETCLLDEAASNIFRLVNNAGVALEARRPGPCHLTDEEMWDTTMNVNAKSVFLGCKYGTKQMLKQQPHPSGDRGWIINMSSIMGIVASNDHRKYCSLCFSHVV